MSIRGLSGRTRKKPTTGELNTPVSILSSEYVPDSGTGFNHEVEPLLSEWARVRYGKMTYKKGSNSDSVITHEVTVRNSGVVIDEGMLVSIGSELFRVVATMPLDDAKSFILIYVVPEGEAKDNDYTVVDSEDTEVSDSSETNDVEGFWTQGY